MMESSREFWNRWAESLRKYELQNIVASLLEGTSPLTVVGVQVIYFSGGLIRNDQLSALAAMLEDENEARAFASYLNQSGAKS